MFGCVEIAASDPGDDNVLKNYGKDHAANQSTACFEDCWASCDSSLSTPSVALFVDGYPHWSNASASKVRATEIVDAYLRHGCASFERLNGSFALALFDRRTRQVTLAIDRMGIMSLAWTRQRDRIIFSTSPARIANRPNADATILPQMLYEYFFFHMIPSPDTVFSGVRKLRPGTAMVFSVSGHREVRYWTPSFSRARGVSAQELERAVREALRAAVQTQYLGPTTGAFLSGGLDSSTVVGYLSEMSDEPAQTFSIGFDVDAFDELEYARATNEHFGCRSHEYRVTPQDVLDAIPIVASTFDEPFGNSSAIPTYACARFAKASGVDRLLAGDGGDEIFGGNERYARQRVFEVFGLLPKGMQSRVKNAVHRIAPDHSMVMMRKLRSYVDQAAIPLPERYESWNFVYREGAAIMFCEDFVEGVDSTRPFREMNQVFSSAASSDLLDRMLHYDWKFTLADNDLRKVTAMCAAASIEVAFPMLDNRVVDASIQVPSAMKMRGLQLRSFYKRTMKDFLPARVLTKKKHGFGLPFGDWLKTHAGLADSVYSSLSDLKDRGIIKASFIDNLIAQHREGHAGYYGYVIWDLVILEEWLKHQAGERKRTSERTSSRSA